jgi:hypothetical protein
VAKAASNRPANETFSIHTISNDTRANHSGFHCRASNSPARPAHSGPDNKGLKTDATEGR